MTFVNYVYKLLFMVKDIEVIGIDKIKSAVDRIKDFSPIHNTYREDVNIIINLLDHSKNINENQSLYRIVIHSFFSMVEADLYYYNQLNPYKGYRDRDGFVPKFKATFEYTCAAVDKEALQKQYFVDSLDELLSLRDIRNRLFHPKKPADVCRATLQDIDKLNNIVESYNHFIEKLMDGFMFKFYPSSKAELQEIMIFMNKK